MDRDLYLDNTVIYGFGKEALLREVGRISGEFCQKWVEKIWTQGLDKTTKSMKNNDSLRGKFGNVTVTVTAESGAGRRFVRLSLSKNKFVVVVGRGNTFGLEHMQASMNEFEAMLNAVVEGWEKDKEPAKKFKQV